LNLITGQKPSPATDGGRFKKLKLQLNFWVNSQTILNQGHDASPDECFQMRLFAFLKKKLKCIFWRLISKKTEGKPTR